MTDTKALREKYATSPPACPVCGHTLASQAAGNGLDSFWCPAAVTPKIEVEHYTGSLRTLPSGHKHGDPAVLALCAEVEALRAQAAQSAASRGVGEADYLEAVHQLGGAIRERDEARAKVAAAPEVLREWPKTVEEAPGEWFFCIHGDCAPRGTFATWDGYALPVFVDESGGSLWVSGEMKPGEFFVRVP